MRIVLRALLFVIACAVIVAIVAPRSASPLVVGAIAAAGAFGLTFLFTRWDRVSLGDIGAAFQGGSIPRFALGFAIGLAVVAAWVALLTWFGSAHWVRGTASIADGLLACAAYVALAAREELAFRGYPLRRLDQRFGALIAQIAIAVLFALEHRVSGATWTQAFLGAGVGSLLFGAASLRSRGLAMPIGIHAAWNLGHWAAGFKGTSGFWKASGVSDATAMLLYLVVMLTATTLIRLRRKKSA